MHEGVVGVAHGALHLVVDHALVGQTTCRVVWVGEFQPVALLAEVIIVQVW